MMGREKSRQSKTPQRAHQRKQLEPLRPERAAMDGYNRQFDGETRNQRIERVTRDEDEHDASMLALVRALAILKKLDAARTSEYVFPGQRPGKPLSGMAMATILRRMKIDNATVHGFRSSFSDWRGEVSSFPGEIAEAALSHLAGDQTERAYRRGDALEKRRALMEAWANYCEPKAGNVVSIVGRPR